VTTICTFCHGGEGGEEQGGRNKREEGEQMGEEEGFIQLEERVSRVVERNASLPSAFDTTCSSGIKESSKRSTDIW
jgi:flagellar biosynthesis/type III secretory pathway protein FliH